MASAKPDLTRAGTMQLTAKDGTAFLQKNLTDWKKPYLMDHCEDGEEEEAVEESSEEEAPPAKTPKLAKHTTMKGTAKDAKLFLDGKGRPDEDALTRTQQKKIEEIQAEKPSSKKVQIARDNTMAATAKEAKALLGKEKLADTRQETKAKKSKVSPMKRGTTMKKAVEEAKVIYGDINLAGGRQLRKRKSDGKPTLKKAGTMVNTAKEGKAFLKRGKKSKK